MRTCTLKYIDTCSCVRQNQVVRFYYWSWVAIEILCRKTLHRPHCEMESFEMQKARRWSVHSDGHYICLEIVSLLWLNLDDRSSQIDIKGIDWSKLFLSFTLNNFVAFFFAFLTMLIDSFIYISLCAVRSSSGENLCFIPSLKRSFLILRFFQQDDACLAFFALCIHGDSAENMNKLYISPIEGKCL